MRQQLARTEPGTGFERQYHDWLRTVSVDDIWAPVANPLAGRR